MLVTQQTSITTRMFRDKFWVSLLLTLPTLVWGHMLSRASYRKMMQNLWWAAGYNIFAIPLAAGLLARWASCARPRPGRCSCRPAP
jgi:cation transport ATPase